MTYLQSQCASMFGHQEIGQIDRTLKARVEQQQPNNGEILLGQFYCNANNIILHKEGSRKQENDSNRSHVQEQVHRIKFLPTRQQSSQKSGSNFFRWKSQDIPKYHSLEVYTQHPVYIPKKTNPRSFYILSTYFAHGLYRASVHNLSSTQMQRKNDYPSDDRRITRNTVFNAHAVVAPMHTTNPNR